MIWSPLMIYHWLIHSDKCVSLCCLLYKWYSVIPGTLPPLWCFTIQVNELQPPRPLLWILKYWILTPLAYSSTVAHFVAHPRTSVHHGNQQEVTGDKWMSTNLMSDGNYPNHSDFYGLCFLFLTLFYCSAAEHYYSSHMHMKATLCTE